MVLPASLLTEEKAAEDHLDELVARLAESGSSVLSKRFCLNEKKKRREGWRDDSVSKGELNL